MIFLEMTRRKEFFLIDRLRKMNILNETSINLSRSKKEHIARNGEKYNGQ